MSRIIDNIELPAGLRDLDIARLERVAGEVRSLILNTVCKTGGHLAPNLGVVELTTALFKVFDPSHDRIVWDVGHQCYPHKILTGRKDRMGSLRQYGGISGFTRISESPYDCFGAGHSGTALSAALGFAAARDRQNGDKHVIAILGDGAAGCGISFEAFNNIINVTQRLIVILNDNEMSIASNVGSLSNHLGKLLANPRYNRLKRGMERIAAKLKMGWLRSTYYRMEEIIKGMFLRSVMFEEFGLRYIGPVDGHNIRALVDAFTIAKEYDRPILIHVTTQKGRGYELAEQAPEKWHGTSPFELESGKTISVSEHPSYSNIFGYALERIAEKDDKVVAITAAMPEGTGLTSFAKKFPDRFFDVGISEEHAMVFAAGLAAAGMRPVFAVYSTFFQRSVDCMIHDVCLQKLPVVVCLDRAGIVGDDGPTHHGVFDIALMRPVPGVTIMQPGDEAELPDMLFTAFSLKRPVVIRYPRGAGTGVHIRDDLKIIPIGTAQPLKEGKDVVFWALGDMIQLAMGAADLLEKSGISSGVVNARFVKPLDTALLKEHTQKYRRIVTLENGVIAGGFGCAVSEFVEESGSDAKVLKLGWPDTFIPWGNNNILFGKYGLTSSAIAEKTKIFCSGRSVS